MTTTSFAIAAACAFFNPQPGQLVLPVPVTLEQQLGIDYIGTPPGSFCQPAAITDAVAQAHQNIDNAVAEINRQAILKEAYAMEPGTKKEVTIEGNNVVLETSTADALAAFSTDEAWHVPLPRLRPANAPKS